MTADAVFKYLFLKLSNRELLPFSDPFTKLWHNPCNFRN